MSIPSRTKTRVSTPAYQDTSRKLSERSVHGSALVAEAVADAAHGTDQFHCKGVIHLAAQVTHVHVDDVSQTLEALVPDVLDDHGAREHAAGIGGEVFQQRVFLGREFDAAAGAAHLLRQSIDLQIRHAQHARTCSPGPAAAAPSPA